MNIGSLVTTNKTHIFLFYILTLTTKQGSVLGKSVVSNGSDARRWFPQEAEQEEKKSKSPMEARCATPW